MLPSERSNERLLALAVMGVLALNYPMLFIFSNASLIFGIPILYFYLFVVWGAFILLAALIVERIAKKEKTIKNGVKKSGD
jgi:hypothetical protein